MSTVVYINVEKVTCIVVNDVYYSATLASVSNGAQMSRDAAATRARLIIAARRHFAQSGYEGAKVRDIAADAKVAPALINRYFGGKERLFAQAVAIDLDFPDLSAMPREKVGTAMVEHFFRRWEGDQSDDLLRVLVRTAATTDEAAERIRSIFTGQIVPVVRQVAGDEDAEQRAALIATQMLGLAYCRYVLGLEDSILPRAMVIHQIGATVQRYLTGTLDIAV